MYNNTCCFIGHRQIEVTIGLKERLTNILKKLIVDESIDTFLFGSKSQFNDLCYSTVSNLKKDFSYLKRIYVRAEFPFIDDSYKAFLLKGYEDTYYPENIINAGKYVYVQRNFEMIDKSRICVFYYNKQYSPPTRKRSRSSLTYYQARSGTDIAYNHAEKMHKSIINIFENQL